MLSSSTSVTSISILPFKSSTIWRASFSPIFGNLVKYKIFSLLIASTIPLIEPVASIGRASFGPKPLTLISFKKSSNSSFSLKPYRLYSSSPILLYT